MLPVKVILSLMVWAKSVMEALQTYAGAILITLAEKTSMVKILMYMHPE